MRVIWRKVKYRGFKDRYMVSNYGDVKSLLTNELIKPWLLPNGGLIFTLCKDSRTKRIMAHKIVFQHFKLEELDRAKWIHHIDFDKQNNHVPNLEQKSRSEYLRLCHVKLNKVRGVYKFRGRFQQNMWRVALKHKGNVLTLGYFPQYSEAVSAYYSGYEALYGYPPFQEQA